MKQIAAFLSTFIACLLWIYGHSCVAFALELSEVEQMHATNIWMLCDSIAKSFTFLALVIVTTGYFREWLLFMLGLCVNNLLDELIFDPLTIGLNEYALLIVLAIYYSHKITKAVYAST